MRDRNHRRRAAIARGVAFGVVAFLHAMLLALLLAWHGNAITPWIATEHAPSAEPLDVRYIDHHAAPAPPPLRIPAPPRAVRPAPAPERVTVAQPDTHEADAAPVEPPSPREAAPPSGGDGDPALRKALDEAGHRAGPSLPGYAAGSLVGGIRLAPPPPSVRDTIHRMGNYMECSRIRMRRNLPGGTLDYQVMQAYEKLGCKK